MKRVLYKFLIDADVVKSYKLDSRSQYDIELSVGAYLNDPEGWSNRGYFFESVDKNEKVVIRLSRRETIENICGLSKNLSCAELGGRHMYLNADRWFRGASASKLTLEDYRQYMVSHEIGHILGYEHTKCPCVKCKAPIMMQQTLGIGQCKPNTKIF
jgi:hypothetical protein